MIDVPPLGSTLLTLGSGIAIVVGGMLLGEIVARLTDE